METLLLHHPDANSTSVIVSVCVSVSLPMPNALALALLACRAALGCHSFLSAQWRADKEKSLMSEHIHAHPDGPGHWLQFDK